MGDPGCATQVCKLSEFETEITQHLQNSLKRCTQYKRSKNPREISLLYFNNMVKILEV